MGVMWTWRASTLAVFAIFFSHAHLLENFDSPGRSASWEWEVTVADDHRQTEVYKLAEQILLDKLSFPETTDAEKTFKQKYAQFLIEIALEENAQKEQDVTKNENESKTKTQKKQEAYQYPAAQQEDAYQNQYPDSQQHQQHQQQQQDINQGGYPNQQTQQGIDASYPAEQYPQDNSQQISTFPGDFTQDIAGIGNQQQQVPSIGQEISAQQQQQIAQYPNQYPDQGQGQGGGLQPQQGVVGAYPSAQYPNPGGIAPLAPVPSDGVYPAQPIAAAYPTQYPGQQLEAAYYPTPYPVAAVYPTQYPGQPVAAVAALYPQYPSGVAAQNLPLPYPYPGPGGPTRAPETLEEVDKLIQQIFRLNITGILDQSLYLVGSSPIRNIGGGVLKLVFCDPVSRLLGRCRGNNTATRSLEWHPPKSL